MIRGIFGTIQDVVAEQAHRDSGFSASKSSNPDTFNDEPGMMHIYLGRGGLLGLLSGGRRKAVRIVYNKSNDSASTVQVQFRDATRWFFQWQTVADINVDAARSAVQSARSEEETTVPQELLDFKAQLTDHVREAMRKYIEVNQPRMSAKRAQKAARALAALARA